MKKFLALTFSLLLVLTTFTACRKNISNDEDGKIEDEAANATLNFAALESAYGSEMWKKIADEFEKENSGVTVNVTTSKTIEDVLSPQMKAGDYPDVVHLATGREKALTETLTKEKSLEDISDVLKMTVPGEAVTVEEKLLDGFTDTLITKPYGDGKLYLAPMFYSPCGLFYNKALFEQKGWSVPETWDEMWKLGDKAKEENISLFTYPTSGYFDSFFYALLASHGNTEFYNSALTYKEGIWDSDEAKEALGIIGKLKDYTEPTTVSNANNENYLKNQQLVLDNKALFMPNGTWVKGEMADAPMSDDFEWGFAPLPALKEGGDRYSYTFFEQMWIPKNAKNKDLAKKFIAFMYSDKAAEIFADEGDAVAVQPIKGVSRFLDDEEKEIYSIYDNGIKAAMGSFASTEPVEGVSIFDEVFSAIDSVISGETTVDIWRARIAKASDKLREAMK